MSGPVLPNGDTPLPMVDSHPDPIPCPTGVGQPIMAARSDVVSVVVEQRGTEKRTVEGEGVRVRIATDKEEAPPHVTLPFEPVKVQRVSVGRMVESAPPVREEGGIAIVPSMGVTETRLMPQGVSHVRRVAKTREHQQTIPLRRQCAEAERLPAKGKPLTEARTATSIEDNQR